ncbi:IucA/IucC family protein [Xanthomonas translucens]|uniref:IucA/IucC family protein n=1 Tax=Xanthomonas campestris pv. translucens TaxID=343 RepID=UPI0019D57C66|nr:IucA/IucC family protein [Xanthomonas translucens]QSQ29983.1 IucA/IucC family siderophore biosynthesis protein [Xanthomonas translucens pv. translucens]
MTESDTRKSSAKQTLAIGSDVGNFGIFQVDGDADSAYITQRIIDCCLREDLHAIASQGYASAPPLPLDTIWPALVGQQAELWWQVLHWPGGPIWLPVRRSDHMQPVAALSDGWLRRTAQGVQLEFGAQAWLALLAEGRDEKTRILHEQYVKEAALAVKHRALARSAFAVNAERLAQVLDHPQWSERLLLADQLASYRDHPFYPTARAKTGFDEAALRAYAPEYNPSFELHWLAVPRDQATVSTPVPDFWPRLRELGFDAALESSHAAFPVHPMTWPRLDEFALPDGTLRAQSTYLRVRPSLSVRTVIPLDHPTQHLKLPLLMFTLGALSLRLMRPSSLYDGFWFQRVLNAIRASAPALHDRYVHVDEAHFGHVADSLHLSYLLRVYPSMTERSTPVPVAALCAPMPDGRAFSLHLADRFYAGDVLAWWRDYLDLLCGVHLRLWLAYGFALEANQQNTVIIYSDDAAPRLLMKDNDAGRVYRQRLHNQLPEAEAFGPLHNQRILVPDDTALGQMFCTITLQLNLLAVLECVAEANPALHAPMLGALRQGIVAILQNLQDEGIDTRPAWHLFDAPRLPVKYLLSAGSLLSKDATGATDIQKFYGNSAPNFMVGARRTQSARRRRQGGVR